jgi:hypothetical protein
MFKLSDFALANCLLSSSIFDINYLTWLSSASFSEANLSFRAASYFSRSDLSLINRWIVSLVLAPAPARFFNFSSRSEIVAFAFDSY